MGVLCEDRTDCLLVLNCLSHSISVETAGSTLQKVIEKNTTIPTKRSFLLETADSQQRAMDIEIFMGEAYNTKDNKKIGYYRFEPVLPQSEIEIIFDVDELESLTVTIQDLSNSSTREIIRNMQIR